MGVSIGRLPTRQMLSGVNFFTGILLARYLGVMEFGIFTLAWLIVEFVQGIQYSLVITPMISIGPKQSEHERLIISVRSCYNRPGLPP